MDALNNKRYREVLFGPQSGPQGDKVKVQFVPSTKDVNDLVEEAAEKGFDKDD